MPRFRQQEVVALRRIAPTGHRTVETAREGLEKGAREHLRKQCDFNTLLGSIHKAYETVAEGVGRK